MIEVKANSNDFSVDRKLLAKVSQCVAFGVSDQGKSLAGLSHLYIRSNTNQLLDNLFNYLIKSNLSDDYIISACGGVYAFIPGYGLFLVN